MTAVIRDETDDETRPMIFLATNTPLPSPLPPAGEGVNAAMMRGHAALCPPYGGTTQHSA